MKSLYIILLLTTLLVGCQFSAIAQSSFDPLAEDIGDRLPTLEVLVDSAIANNPYVRFRDLQVTVNESKLRSRKIEWTRNLGLQANIGYGNLYNYSTNFTGGIEPVPFSTNRTETQYNTSAYINLPIYTVADRRNLIKMAKAEIDQAASMAGQQRLETRMLVIQHYNDLVLAQRVMKIRARYMETARINMQMVEKEFSNGVVPVTEYTRITEIVTRAEADYERANTDFLTEYLLLEELTGMKFNLSN